MKKIFAFAIIAMTALVTFACTSKKQAEAPAAKKALVLYYSQTNTTKAVAEEIARLTGSDIEAINLVEPYDGDFMATVQRAQRESASSTLPTLKPIKAKIANYDVLYLGYPIWSGTYASPIKALLRELSLEGITVVPFCSFGSGGLETSVNDLRQRFPNATILDGYGVRTARIKAMPAEVDRFLKENGLIKGKVEALPEFCEQHPATDVEKAIFKQACSSYQFPLGNPVTCGKRQLGEKTEYKFAVDNQSTIYVIQEKVGDELKAEFTRVVR